MFVLILVALLFSSQSVQAQFIQQGPKLVGTGAVSDLSTGDAFMGSSVALSADGNTALVGGPDDNGGIGAVWVFTRSGGVWIQQGSKLVGTGAVGSARQGSVALSADGNTALVGGSTDNSNAGAAWVFTRSGGVWTQQGPKLVGTGAVNPPVGAYQGSVALSADGNTALVGGWADNNDAGATWVFTRSGGVWSQQGSKLVGTGAGGFAEQGGSVALSADGNTALVGGSFDNPSGPFSGNAVGAAWVFTRYGGVWTQQGNKLVGTGAGGFARQGSSVALSADGNTALVGGSADNAIDQIERGATWVFTRSGGVWTQQGSKLVGTGGVGASLQGISVALSADGNTALVGGYLDGDGGATWVFTRSGGVWTQQGSKLVGAGAGQGSDQGVDVALSADGHTALVGQLFDEGFWVFVRSVKCAALVRRIENMTSGDARLIVTERRGIEKRLQQCVLEHEISLEQGDALRRSISKR
jgi:hypothetical protein